jgi:hypothetical protein
MSTATVPALHAASEADAEEIAAIHNEAIAERQALIVGRLLGEAAGPGA